MKKILPLFTALLFIPVAMAGGSEPVGFNRDVRPILSDRCFACHGPDEHSRAAGLRLDVRDSAIEFGGFVPGDPEASELIRRVTTADADERMPPPEHGEALTPAQIAVLQRWIAEGAPYEEHWSFQPLVRPAIPTRSGNRAPNPIDAFIAERLEEEGLALSPPADPRVLMRRLAFDLTGLPPQPAAVQRFREDRSDAAFSKYVAELLNSSHYGERMALYWLDLVRYADTLGYHGDQPRSVSPYRDYVIAAFNENKPFDRFTTEQIAGDLLPEATLDQKVASTYNRLNRASGEGGVQPKEYLAKYSADRVRTTGTVWLGTTFGCAECHDHKFDPFTIKDFYSFAAFFADIKEQGIVRGANHIEKLPVPTEAQQQRLDELARQIAQAERALKAQSPALRNARRDWEQQIVSDAERWTLLRPHHFESTGGATLKVQDDHSVLASGKNPDRDTYVIEAEFEASADSKDIALRLELLPDASLPQSGPGRAGNGNLVLHGVDLTLAGRKVRWTSAAASHSQTNHAAEHVINGHQHGWAILPQTGRPVQLMLIGKLQDAPEAAQRSESIDPDICQIRLTQNHGSGHNLGRFRLSLATDAKITELLAATDQDIAKLAAIAESERTAEQEAKLDAAFRSTTPRLKEPRDRLAKLQGERERLNKSVVTTLASKATEPRMIRVLPRGNWMDDSGEVVEPAVPGFLPKPNAAERDRLTRLDLAQWMTSPDNPLVARTFVNRLWMLFFGHGLARNVDDLGSQGEPPTHPQLLDWLASEFIDSGWDVKHMVRLMVTSRTYQQTSRADADLTHRDPYNRLYARQSRWRLDAEMIRDNALLVSGLLNRQIGGPSVKPYQPAGYWSQLNFPRRTYRHDPGPAQYRRGLYTHWQRTFLNPSLLAFDAPAREECTAQRSRSNTPLQSLVLLNDPTYVEAARVLAERVLGREADDFDQRLGWLFQQTLMRQPRGPEVAALKELLTTDLQEYRAANEAAQQLLSVGQAPASESLEAAELAAWTSVTRVLLNLHESITRY